MGLFSRKKKEDNKFLPLPEFPRLPGENMPFYDEQLHENKDLPPLPPAKADFSKSSATPDFFEKKVITPKFKDDLGFDSEIPQRRSPLTLEKRDDKPVFVKIDRYRESMKTLETIKSKIEEADELLKNLAKLRQDEERELEDWQNSLNEIRQKLLKIDKDLFEA
ncbi:MAG: hypothetical protein AABW58_03240 [Nanoarchaeota archaeon]